jgi:hypothetical protein
MDNKTFHLEFPFTKIDEERRVVVGIATADNIDKSDEIVDFKASLDAFGNWIGNIREMHAPKAVGKALSYRPVDVYDDNGQLVRAIEVEAYVSKGAEDTWQKVLDRTLKGFSIGGNIEDAKPEFHTRLKKMVRRITKYALGELSLVDNPCNPIAHISVVKSHGGDLTYELNKADTYEVYFCRNCGVATYDESACSTCKSDMVLIGDVTEFDQASISKMIESYLKGGGDMEDLQKNENDATITNVEENSLDTDAQSDNSNTHVALSVVKTIASSMVPQFNIFTTTGTSTSLQDFTSSSSTTEGEVKIVEKSEDTVETVEGGEEVNTDELVKSLSAMMDEKLNEFKTDIVATVDEKIETVAKSVEVSEADADESLSKGDESEVDERDELIKSLTERLDALETKGAVKKSIDDDSDEDTEVITKNTPSLWNGMFVPMEVVNALGYES